MPNDCISYTDSGYFIPIVTDYLDQKAELKPLFNRFPTLDNFGPQIIEKELNYRGSREILVSALKTQYQHIKISTPTADNISSLLNTKTFTVTTGHQLNLFTGPLYFLYKIVTTINLAKALQKEYPENRFVPVYWMATEDHDFEEINYFNFNGKKFRWNRKSAGAVGRLSTDGLEEFFRVFSAELGNGINADALRQLFSDTYLKHNSLSDATRFLADALFGKYGLVIIDGDHADLKKQFIPFIKEELLQQTSYKCVSETIQSLSSYDIQVKPREINLFYLGDNLRERIILKDGLYHVNNTEIVFSQRAILSELKASPEKFSPNVILRPLYQEVILPNLCYIGGGGELAYWFELKSFFDSVNTTFPIMMLRNSVLIAKEKQALKADKLNLTWAELFLSPVALSNKKIHEFSQFQLDFTRQKDFLKQQFFEFHAIASQTDPSFRGAVNAQEKKQINGLENLEKKLIKAEKRKYADQLERIAILHEALFPNGGLQERFANFTEMYLHAGNHFIEKLIAELNPMEDQFTITII